MRSSLCRLALPLLTLPLVSGLAPAAASADELRLTASDAAPGDGFGDCVDVDGDTAVVGAPFDDDLGSSSGAVYVFERTGTTWTETAKLVAADGGPGRQFGSAVALDGERLAIGSQGDPAGGAVYVYTREGSGWTREAKLLPFDHTSSAPFMGRHVDVEGGTLVAVGDVANGIDGVFVFVLGVAGWSPQTNFFPSDGVPGGWSSLTGLALDGGRIVTGVPNDFDEQGQSAGNASVYVRSGSAWILEERLYGNPNDWHGSSVSISAEWMAVGAQVSDEPGAIQSGSATVYRRSGASWFEWQRIPNPDARVYEKFGGAVAIEQGRLVVGAELDDDMGADSGSVYVYETTGSGWLLKREIHASNGTAGDLFGSALAMDDGNLFVGAPSAGAGAVYVYCLSPGDAYCFCASGGPVCGGLNPDTDGGCANSTGRGALLLGYGSAEVQADDLILMTTRLPVFRTGLLYMGPNRLGTPLGAGLRCVGAGGAGLYRYGLRTSGSEGRIVYGALAGLSQNFPAAGNITAGQTWNFQLWYRDPDGPCEASNLSNGYAVTFAP